MDADLVLRNGRIVTPAGVINGGLAVSEGRIVSVGEDSWLPAGVREVDLAGKVVIPGVVDPEAHLGTSRTLAADFETETQAAAAAGVTTWGLQLTSAFIAGDSVDIKGPDDIPGFVGLMGAFHDAARSSSIDYFLTPIVTHDRHVDEIQELATDHGITSFKFHLNSGGQWRPESPTYAFDDGTVYAAFEQVSALTPQGVVLLHCENWQIARVLQTRLQDAGRVDIGAWDEHSPWLTEAAHAREYLYYAHLTSCPVYIVHVTTEATMREIERSKAEGVTVFGEIGTHYLVLDRDAWKINVPLRDRSTHEALWQGLASGRIDCVGSDHVAHERSRDSMWTADVWTTISGFPSRVEALLPILLSDGVNQGRLSLERLVEVTSANPARIFGLYPKKGALQVGSDADLVVVDLDRTTTVSADNLHTASSWTIFEGLEMTGLPVMTFLHGEQVMDWPDDAAAPKILRPGLGRYLPRTAAATVEA